MKILTKPNNATNGQNQATEQNQFINLLLQDGLENSLPKIAEMLINAAMLLERIQHIRADPHPRNVEARNGYANGFKPRSYHSTLGKLQLSVPQVRLSHITNQDSLLRLGRIRHHRFKDDKIWLFKADSQTTQSS